MTLLQPYQDTTGIYTLLSHDSWYVRLLKAAAMTIPFKKLVPYSISFISGWTPDEFDPVRFFQCFTRRSFDFCSVSPTMPQYIWILHFSSKSHINTRRCTKLMVFFKCTTMGKRGTCRCMVLQNPLFFLWKRSKRQFFWCMVHTIPSAESR
jgi:hypothetical protein